MYFGVLFEFGIWVLVKVLVSIFLKILYCLCKKKKKKKMVEHAKRLKSGFVNLATTFGCSRMRRLVCQVSAQEKSLLGATSSGLERVRGTSATSATLCTCTAHHPC